MEGSINLKMNTYSLYFQNRFFYSQKCVSMRFFKIFKVGTLAMGENIFNEK